VLSCSNTSCNNGRRVGAGAIGFVGVIMQMVLEQLVPSELRQWVPSALELSAFEQLVP
jgi:hypothetical protein